MIKTYKLIAWDCSATFKVDLEKMPKELPNQINTFFMDHEYRLDLYDGDEIAAALSLIAERVIHIMFSNNYHMRGVISEFDWKKDGQEGFPNIDGSYGIELVDVDELSIGEFEVEIKQ